MPLNNNLPINELYELLKTSRDEPQYSEENKFYDIAEHTEANYIANLLVNIELKSPRLNKDFIKKLHSGEVNWQTADGNIITLQEDFDFNLLEELGILFFEYDWVVVNASLPSDDSEYIHSSIKPILKFVKSLKNILYIRENFQGLKFGINKDLYHQIIPDQYEFRYVKIECKSEISDYIVNIKTKKESILRLVANYYWKYIFKSDSTNSLAQYHNLRQSFRDFIQLPDITIFSDDEKQRFLSFCVDSINAHPFFNMPLEKYKSLSYSSNYLKTSFTSSKISFSIPIGTEDASSKESTEYQPLPLEQVTANYKDQFKEENKVISDLELINSNLRYRDNYILKTPFYGFLLYVINSDLFVNYYGVSSQDLLINIIEQSYKKSLLRHYLVNNLFSPFYNDTRYHLFLLSREKDFLAGFVNTVQCCKEKFNTKDNAFASTKLRLAYLLQDTLIKVALNNRTQELALLVIYLAEKYLSSLDDKQFFEYEVLKSLFDNLMDHQLKQLFPMVIDELEKLEPIRNKEGKGLLKLLFLMAETCQRFNTKEVIKILNRLQLVINTLYQKQFNFSQSVDYPYLDTDSFYDSFPWHVCNDREVINKFLSLLPDAREIIGELSKNTTHAIYYRSTLRNLIQVLLNLLTLPSAEKDKIQMHLREVIIHTGFTGSNLGSLLLDDFLSNQYKLWDKIAIALNEFDDKDFTFIVDKLTHLAPLYAMIVLYTNTFKQERKNDVLKAIFNNQDNWNLDDDNISLPLIERLLVISLEEKQLTIAKAVLDEAKKVIETHPYKNHDFFISTKNNWRIYEYKYNLLNIYYSEDSEQEKIKQIEELKEPEVEKNNISPHDIKHIVKEMHLFKRYLSGLLYEKDDPAKMCEIFTELYNKYKSEMFASLVFAAKIASLAKDTSATLGYKQAIKEYESSLPNFSFDNLSLQNKSNYIYALYLAQDYEEAGLICSKLPRLEKFYKPITITYSKVLRGRKNPLGAQKLVEEYKSYHATHMPDQELEKEIEEIHRSIESDILPIQKVTLRAAILFENKSNDELKALYREIKDKPIKDLAYIINDGNTVEEFIYEHALGCFEELRIRLKNLEKITESKKEDLINDWFVSLFNQRFVSFSTIISDQKRAGSSETGIGVGETDGIFYYKNRAVSLFEAFNLSSIDKKIIDKHLNKITNYDLNSLSPIIVVAYCSFKNFSKGVEKYIDYIKTKNYEGFNEISDLSNHQITKTQENNAITALSEHRHRGCKEITIYHFLMNLKMD